MATLDFALVAFVLWIAVIAVHAEGFSLPSTPPNQPPSSSPSPPPSRLSLIPRSNTYGGQDDGIVIEPSPSPSRFPPSPPPSLLSLIPRSNTYDGQDGGIDIEPSPSPSRLSNPRTPESEPMQAQDGNKYLEYDGRSPKRPKVIQFVSPGGQTGTTPGGSHWSKIEAGVVKSFGRQTASVRAEV